MLRLTTMLLCRCEMFGHESDTTTSDVVNVWPRVRHNDRQRELRTKAAHSLVLSFVRDCSIHLRFNVSGFIFLERCLIVASSSSQEFRESELSRQRGDCLYALAMYRHCHICLLCCLFVCSFHIERVINSCRTKSRATLAASLTWTAHGLGEMRIIYVFLFVVLICC